MRLIMGLEAADSGEVWLRGKNLTRETAGARNFGYVPQSFALYPYYRVFDNIAYPLLLAKETKAGVRDRVELLARKLRIDRLLDKYPNQLSGGEKQRVALARGMIKVSSVFILDDPLAGLDFKLREQLFIDLRDMLGEVEGTFIYTTSDPLEAQALADDVYVLDDHRVIESGTLDRVYDAPMTLPSLQLLGYPAANVMPGEMQATICRTPLGEFEVELQDSSSDSKEIQVGFRPEAVEFGSAIATSALVTEARALLREDLGAETLLYFEAASCRFIGYWSNGSTPPITSDRFKVGIEHSDLLVFDRQSGRRIGRGAKKPARTKKVSEGSSAS
jgi:ABC-type sugar transport system ATPase subunit